MKTKSYGVMLAIAELMLFSFSPLVRADFIPVVDFTGGGLTTAPGNFSLGFQFTVGSLPFEVTAVGLRAGTPPSGQTVRIYENGTITNTLAQAVFASDPLSGNGIYKYVDLATPILLQANTTYNFVVDHLPGDSILVLAGASSNNPDLTYVQSIGDGNAAGFFPTADNVHFGAYAGGMFQGHTVVDPCTTAVPTSGCTVNGVPNQPCQGGSNDDILLGTSGNDVIRGGAGADTLKGNAGEDVVCGEEGNDTLLGANGNDTLIGGQGSDVLKGEAGNDTLDGGSEDDTLIGGMGMDLLDGGSGNDKLIGNEEADVLLGDTGNDILNGGDGNDTVDGEVGFDDLTGGPGTDACLNGEQLTTCE